MQLCLRTKRCRHTSAVEIGNITHELQGVAQPLFADEQQIFALCQIPAVPFLKFGVGMGMVFYLEPPFVLLPAAFIVAGVEVSMGEHVMAVGMVLFYGNCSFVGSNSACQIILL